MLDEMILSVERKMEAERALPHANSLGRDYEAAASIAPSSASVFASAGS